MLLISNPKIIISLLVLNFLFGTCIYAQVKIIPKYDINGGPKKSTWPNRKKAEREKKDLESERKKIEFVNKIDDQSNKFGKDPDKIIFDDINEKRRDAEIRMSKLYSQMLIKFGTDSTCNKLGELITSKFEITDPLEYFLSDYPKYSNKKNMIDVESELRALMKIYRENCYVKGHIKQKQNNAYILNSLIGIKYAEQGFDAQSPPNPHNSSIIQLKKFADKDIVYSEQSNNSSILLNQAVLLMQKNKSNDAEVIIDKIITGIENKNYKTYYLEYYNKALLMFEQKQYGGVKIYANKSKKVKSDFYLADLLIGDTYLETDSALEALHYYKNSASVKDNIISQERIAFANLKLGNYKEASFYYQKIIDNYKSRPDGIVYRELNALALAHQGKFKESLTIVSNLKAFKKDSPIPHFIEGWNYLLNDKDSLINNYLKAIECFTEAKNKGDSLYSGIGKAFAYYYLKNYQKSSEYFLELENTVGYEKYKNNKSVLLMAAFAFTNTRNYKDAEEKFNSYSKYYKKENGYYIGMSMCSFSKYQFSKALHYLDSVKNPPKNSLDFIYLQGICNLKNENNENYKKAVSYFETALKLDSTHVKSYNGLGASLNALYKYDVALLIFNKGINLDKKNPYLIFNKGTAICNIGKKLFGEGKLALALDTVKVGCMYLDSAFMLDNRFRTKLNKGNAYMSVKDSLTAMSYYNDVNSLSSKVNIGVLQANFGNKQMAINTWKEVLKLDSLKKLAIYNLDVFEENKFSNFKSRFGFGNHDMKCYENYYYELVYHYDIEKLFIYLNYLEPLVPLGYSNLKFESLSD